jgi:predicted methyltransferase
MRAAAFALVLLGCATSEPRQGASGPLPITRAVWIESTRSDREPIVPDGVRALLAAPDRLDADRVLDERRQTAELLAFLDVRAGMRVAELGAGGGYMTELLARGVGRDGEVFAVNPPDLVLRAGLAEAWNARLARLSDRNVRPLPRLFDDPFPLEARELDLVYLAFPYFDLQKLARCDAVDRAAFLALRHGGRYVVLDRAVRAKSEHVVHSRNARAEIELVGFVLAAEARFYRSGTLPDEWDAFPGARPTPSERNDRYLLAFVKP